MKVLIDTCVVIDVLQKRQPFFSDAYKIFIAAANNRFEGSLSAETITDIYYIMHKFLHDNSSTRKAINSLFMLFSVLDTRGIDCKKALLSQVKDYEDALMAETALREGMDYIITRNIKDYKNSPVNVLLPKDFLKILSD